MTFISLNAQASGSYCGIEIKRPAQILTASNTDYGRIALPCKGIATGDLPNAPTATSPRLFPQGLGNLAGSKNLILPCRDSVKDHSFRSNPVTSHNRQYMLLTPLSDWQLASVPAATDHTR